MIRMYTPPVESTDVLAARFDAKVHAEPNTGCHLWIGNTNDQGYGLFRCGPAGVDGRRATRRAHVFAWERAHGPVPDGMELDHVRSRGCSGPACVNPDHLEPVTHAENIRRGDYAAARRATCAAITHCPAGHAYDDANTYVDKRNTRHCRACTAARMRRHRAAH
jgi:hypothetical protein